MKKLIASLLCAVMVCSLFMTVSAENELAGAKNYVLGTTARGSLGEDDSAAYRFNLSSAGKITVNLYAPMNWMSVDIYDAEAQRVIDWTAYDNSVTEEINFQNEVYLCAGEYYLLLNNGYNDSGNYEVEIKETAVYESFPEVQNGSNDSVKTASPIKYGQNYIGCIAQNEKTDVYKFNVPGSGKMELRLTGNMPYLRLELMDKDGQRVWDRSLYDNDTTKEIKFLEDLHLVKGTYYLSISGSNHHGEYDFGLSYTRAYESFSENQEYNDNQTSSANLISVNRRYQGQMARNDQTDNYRIVLDGSNPTLNVSGQIPYLRVTLYDMNGKDVWHNSLYDNDTIQEIRFNEVAKVEPGEYYFTVYGSDNYGNYAFYFTDGGEVKDVEPEMMIEVYVDGRKVNFDQQPILENGRTLVPLRAIFEALGAKVEWDDPTQTVTATKGGTKISLQIGSTRMYVNGSEKTLDVPAKLINSRTLVPVRAISEAFGCQVAWEEDTETVYITQ